MVHNGDRKVLVTGLGCITPFGPGQERFWHGLVSGKSGLGPLTAFDPAPYGSKVAGQVADFHPGDFLSQRELSGSPRCVQFALAASRMALDHARLSIKHTDVSRMGVFVGTAVGTAAYLAENHSIFLEKGIRRVHPLFPAFSYSGVVATQLAVSLGIHGTAMCISCGCTSATDAIGIGWMQIRAGLVDRAIVGGAEAPLSPIIFAAFDRLGAMSRENQNTSARFATLRCRSRRIRYERGCRRMYSRIRGGCTRSRSSDLRGDRRIRRDLRWV